MVNEAQWSSIVERLFHRGESYYSSGSARGTNSTEERTAALCSMPGSVKTEEGHFERTIPPKSDLNCWIVSSRLQQPYQ